jgi:anti-sigma factor RsiW
MTDLSCRDVVGLLMSYLDQALDPAQRRAFDAHLAGCDGCVVYLRSYEQTLRLTTAAFEDPDEAPQECSARDLVEAILAGRLRGR